MKSLNTTFFALLACGMLAVLWGLTQIPDNSHSDSVPVEMAGRLNYESNDSGVELGSGGNNRMTGAALEGMTTALLTLDESTDETGTDTAWRPATTQVRTHPLGAGGLRRTELMAEANRIMSDLLRDGLLSEPVGYACAIANTSPAAERATIIIERFRHMHQQHLSLVERALAFGDQDSVVVHGWSQIRFDLAKMQGMAADLRNETALAVR